MCIYDSDILIRSGKDALQAVSSLKLAGGSYRLFAGDTVFNFAASSAVVKGAEVISAGEFISPYPIDSSFPYVSLSLPSNMKTDDKISLILDDTELFNESADIGTGKLYYTSPRLEKGKSCSVVIGGKSYSVDAE